MAKVGRVMAGICTRLALLTPEQVYQQRLRPLAKPEKGAAKAAQRATDRAEQIARDKCRRQVVREDQYHCRRCGRKVWLRPSDAPSVLAIAHCHEWIWRAWGGDPADPTNCICLCAECHALFHPQLGLSAVLWQIVACDPVHLMRGAVEFAPVRLVT